MISVIVPVYNEAAVLNRCLRGLTEGARPGELEVVVVCNGCSDNSADLARRMGPPVRVVESPCPSKSRALNLGDEHATGFPRLYVDADIRLSLDSLRRVAEALDSGAFLAAAPRMRVDLGAAGAAVRAYYRVWMQLPYATGTMLGSGVYAVSRAGRDRLGPFPDVIADDEFVRLGFADHEKTVVEEAVFQFTAPRTLMALIHINVRRRAGDLEMRRRHCVRRRSERIRQRLALCLLALRPWLWPSLVVYGFAKAAAVLLLQLRRAKVLPDSAWARDETSRVATEAQ